MLIEEFLKRNAELVNACLDEYFGRPDEHIPPLLRESMRYSLLAGGKRLRPTLCIAAYEACGGAAHDVILSASALEVIHTYSLVHDDLPAMDDDELRRGKPTNHMVYGEAVAILAGDGLLSEAFLMMLEDGEHIPHERLVAGISEVARASGPGGMVGGQVVDVISEDKEPDAETLKYIHEHKTGALLAASVKLGGLLAGVDQAVMSALSGYGRDIGLAFQIVDDILDVKGDEELLGKPVGSDQARNKMTYPSLFGIENSMKRAEELVASAKDSLEPMRGSGHDTSMLEGLADYIIRRTH